MVVGSTDKLDLDDIQIGKENQVQSLSQQAYEAIRRKIVSLVLPPGSIINESDLQAELGLGRTPIREALQRLALEKLVQIIPRRGIFVTDISITDLQRLFEMRMVLETLAARLAANRGTLEHWSQMEAILANISQKGASYDNETLIAVDELWHKLLYDATDNEFLYDTLTNLYALSLRLWYYFLDKIGDMHWAVMEHEEILRALQDRDPERASALLGQHIRAFQDVIQAAMLGQTRMEA
jgi:DNA-binding GntR family transcriptional regulator